MARITRAQTMNLKKSEFIEAARALGYSRWSHSIPPPSSKFDRSNYSLCDPDCSRSHAIRSRTQLSRAWHTGADELMGQPNQGRGRENGCRSLASLVSGNLFLPVFICT